MSESKVKQIDLPDLTSSIYVKIYKIFFRRSSQS